MLQNRRQFSLSTGLFSLAKWISLVVAILALLAAILFGIMSLAQQGNFHVPRFDSSARTTLLGNLPSNQASVAQQKVNLKLTQEYGSKIISIISKYNISVTKEQHVVNHLASLPKNYRSTFVSGWEDYLSDGIAYAKKEGVYQAVTTNNGPFGQQQESTADLLTQQYFGDYNNAINATESNRGREQINRLINLGMALAALMIFVVAIIVPVLVQVERNTRLLAATASGTEAMTPKQRTDVFATPISTVEDTAAHCPNCQQEIVIGDAFCGNCGHRLS